MIQELIEQIDFNGVAVNVISCVEEEEIAELVYEQNKEAIYKESNIKTKGDYIAGLYDDEDVLNDASGYVESMMKLMGKEDLVIFASKHDSQFLEKVIYIFLEKMVLMQTFVIEYENLRLDEFLEIEVIKDLSIFYKSVKSIEVRFTLEHLKTVLCGQIPLVA